ncbi:hypothetical protein DL93DRAFT_2172350 [Clavulina sp. PMI_390]|nr:hypothetical protein DL93DRAFT_2172350 [Clavulina sp. PMI_390]
MSAIQLLEAKIITLRWRVASWRASLVEPLSPITALPSNLLQYVFELIVLESPRAWHSAVILSHVSRRWRTVSIGDPKLWCRLDLGSPLSRGMVPLFAVRSGDRRLSLSLRGYGDDPDATSPITPMSPSPRIGWPLGSIALGPSEAMQLSRLRFESADAAVAISVHPAAHELLHIDSLSFILPMQRVPLQDYMFATQRLRLKCASFVPRKKLTMPNLIDLYIESCEEDFMVDILNVIDAPALQHLELSGVGWSYHENRPTTKVRAFPHLTTLTIHLCDPKVWAFVADYLVLPDLRSLKIAAGALWSYDSKAFLQQTLLHLLLKFETLHDLSLSAHHRRLIDVVSVIVKRPHSHVLPVPHLRNLTINLIAADPWEEDDPEAFRTARAIREIIEKRITYGPIHAKRRGLDHLTSKDILRDVLLRNGIYESGYVVAVPYM